MNIGDMHNWVDLILIPLFWQVWAINGRLSKIEGQLNGGRDRE
jgi:hypothetical protein